MMSVMEAWCMDESSEHQTLPHSLKPNQQIGVYYWRLNADIYENDPELQKIREERGYSYMDIITVHPDKLPDYENKVKMFYEEHLHLDDEICYILDRSSYFDVRDKDDRWIRIAVSKGDLITVPAGIYHRFTVDETICVSGFTELKHYVQATKAYKDMFKYRFCPERTSRLFFPRF